VVIEEFISKFSFKADTSKVKDFAKKVRDAKEKVTGADSAWARFQNQLKKGIPNQWFQSMSGFLTTFNRTRMFLNGFKNTFRLLDQFTPGGMFSRLNKAITGIMLPMNRFGLTMTRLRSSVRAWMHLMQKGWKNLWISFKAQMSGIWTAMRVGLAKLWIKTKAGLLKLHLWIKKTWSKIVATVMAGNNKFLKAMIGGFQNISGKLGPVLSGFGKSIQGAASKIPILGKALGALPATAVGAVAALGLIVGAVFAVVKSIKAIASATRQFMTFETAMKGVKRVTMATDKEMKQLTASSIKAGEASIFTVTEAATAQKFLGMAGLSVKEVMGALPGVLQLAAAGEMDLARAADISTNIMSSNALQVEDLARINNVLAYTASNSNTNIEQLGSALANIGPAGRLAGLSVEQLSSWLGVLAKNGLAGEESGTMVRNAIMELTNPTKKLTKLMEAGGIAVGDFVDATGKITNINDLFMALQNMDEVAKGQFLAGLGIRPWRALAPIITGNAEAVAQFGMEIGKAGNAAARMAAIGFEGLSGARRQYKSKMGAAAVKFMKTSGLNKLFEEFLRFAADVLPPIIDLIALVFRPFVAILRAVMAVLTPVGMLFKGLMFLINTAGAWLLDMLIGPFEWMFDKFNLLLRNFREFFGWLGGINGFIGSIGEWITKIIDSISGFFSKFEWGEYGLTRADRGPADTIAGATGDTSTSSTTNTAVDTTINIAGVDPNNAASVAAAARSAVAIEIRKILIEAGI